MLPAKTYGSILCRLILRELRVAWRINALVSMLGWFPPAERNGGKESTEPALPAVLNSSELNKSVCLSLFLAFFVQLADLVGSKL